MGRLELAGLDGDAVDADDQTGQARLETVDAAGEGATVVKVEDGGQLEVRIFVVIVQAQRNRHLGRELFGVEVKDKVDILELVGAVALEKVPHLYTVEEVQLYRFIAHG